MSVWVLVVVLASAALHAVWNAIIKGGRDKVVETAMKAAGGGLVVAVILPFLPLPLAESRVYLLMTMCIHLFYYLFIAYAYRGADMSYVYTLMRGSSPLVTALALRHELNAAAWLGVALISAGVLSLTLDSLRRGGFPVKATGLALGNAVVIAAYTVVDGTGVRLSGNAVSYVCWAFFLNAFPISIFAVATRGRSIVGYLRGRWRYGLLGGTCSLLAYGLALWGMTRAPIAMVAALRETSVVFGILLGVFFLHEKATPARVLAIVLVVAGTVTMRA